MKFGSTDSQENHCKKFVANMSDFKAKMHKIQFRLGLHPRPRCRSSQHSPRLLAGFKGPTSKGGERVGNGKVGRERGGKGMRVEGRRGLPRVGSHPMCEILKNTLIAELIWSAGRRRLPRRQTSSRRHWSYDIGLWCWSCCSCSITGLCGKSIFSLWFVVFRMQKSYDQISDSWDLFEDEYGNFALSWCSVTDSENKINA